MAKARRPRTDSVALVTKVLDAAEELLEAQGPTALTARAVAATAGVSPQSIGNRFGSLDEVLGDLSARGFRRLIGRLGSVGPCGSWRACSRSSSNGASRPA